LSVRIESYETVRTISTLERMRRKFLDVKEHTHGHQENEAHAPEALGVDVRVGRGAHWRLLESISSTFLGKAFMRENAHALNWYFTNNYQYTELELSPIFSLNTLHCEGVRLVWFRLNKRRWLFFSRFWRFFKLSIVFRGSWGSSVNWLEPKIEPLSVNLACPNQWNAL